MTLVRFAPSPTGRLHVGNVRTALVNWLFARQQGGRFLLRLDDTDTERSTREFARGIEEDLAWLGLTWDLFARQSERKHRYAEAADQLRAIGRLYPCYETEEELEARRAAQRAAHRPPVYDRAALRLQEADRRRLEAEGRKPHWRFKLNYPEYVNLSDMGLKELEALDISEFGWRDLVRGMTFPKAHSMSDPILIRSDSSPVYSICSVVDDVDFGVTHVIRGEDHVANTTVHIQICHALGFSHPEFAHLPLIAGVEGEKLSKRIDSLSIASLRDDGIEPMTVNSLLAHLGTSEAVEPYSSLDDLVGHFDLGHFGRATPKFDPDELPRLNHRLIQHLSFAEVADRLPVGADEPVWLALRPNLARVAEAADWWTVIRGPIRPGIADPLFAEAAASLLPAEPWDEATWGAWTKAVAQATGRKGKDLYLPLRLALTARAHGPELKSLLVLIGRARAEARLLGKEA